MIAIVLPIVALAGNLTIPAALELSTTYPRPETIVVTVEPSDVIFDCQSIRLRELSEPPKDIASPPIVIAELASLSLPIEPANYALVIVPRAKSAANTEQSTIPLEPNLDIAMQLFINYITV